MLFKIVNQCVFDHELRGSAKIGKLNYETKSVPVPVPVLGFFGQSFLLIHPFFGGQVLCSIDTDPH